MSVGVKMKTKLVLVTVLTSFAVVVPASTAQASNDNTKYCNGPRVQYEQNFRVVRYRESKDKEYFRVDRRNGGLSRILFGKWSFSFYFNVRC
jgi:hypothetical protein